VRRVRDLAAGVVVLRLLDRVGAPQRRRAAATAAPEQHAPAPAPRRGLLGLALGALVLGALLMFVFDAAVTRVAGVAALFCFVVAGVFLIADPRWLAGSEDR
jgi:predicted lipid-binding transport protein (Tim44 family)